MEAATKRRLVEGAERLGVALPDQALDKLGRYLELLLQWNARINLTSIRDPDQIVDRHFLDSLAVVPLLLEEKTLLDVGTGGGFPGAVVAIAKPTLVATCIDRTHKKIAFLQTLRRELQLSIEPLAASDADLAGRRFEAVVSRATWDPPEWLAHGAPLVAPGGLLLAMLSAHQGSLEPPPDFDRAATVEVVIAEVRRRIESFRRRF
jgi:16S rRNA (guanine527-N7)-methyltransferase